jgi:hypothetical protein
MNNYKQQTEPGIKMISLYRLVDDLVSCYKRIKKDHRKFFINEVPRNISISAGDNKLIPELDNLLAIISANPAKTCIRISAINSDNSVKLYLKPTAIKGFSFSGIRVN